MRLITYKVDLESKEIQGPGVLLRCLVSEMNKDEER